MMCLRCCNESFLPVVDRVDQEIDGKTYSVSTPLMKCKACGWQTVGVHQINDLIKNVKKAVNKAKKKEWRRHNKACLKQAIKSGRILQP